MRQTLRKFNEPLSCHWAAQSISDDAVTHSYSFLAWNSNTELVAAASSFVISLYGTEIAAVADRKTDLRQAESFRNQLGNRPSANGQVPSGIVAPYAAVMPTRTLLSAPTRMTSYQ